LKDMYKMGTLIYTHYLIDKVNEINQIAGNVNRGELIASADNRKLITYCNFTALAFHLSV